MPLAAPGNRSKSYAKLLHTCQIQVASADLASYLNGFLFQSFCLISQKSLSQPAFAIYSESYVRVGAIILAHKAWPPQKVQHGQMVSQKNRKCFAEFNHFGPGLEVYIGIQGPMVHMVVAEGISCARSLDPSIFFGFVPHCIHSL